MRLRGPIRHWLAPACPPRARSLVLLAALFGIAAAPAAGQGAEPVRMSARAFGERVEIEVRDLPRERAVKAIRAALREVLILERLTDPGVPMEGGVAELNGAAGQGPWKPDPRLYRLLERAASFCPWSRGASGPLGGVLYRLWGLRRGGAEARPSGRAMEQGVLSAACDRLRLEVGTAELAAGSRVELWGFACGFAVDRAMDMLRDGGAGNAWVEIGWVRRGLGDGPEGEGWWTYLPVVEGFAEPVDRVRLDGRALAVALARERPLEVAGDRHAPYLDQRTGLPAAGVMGVAAITELAVDAQGLATTMFITGNREGQARLGLLRPPPAVMWLLGEEGAGAPLITTFRWSGR